MKKRLQLALIGFLLLITSVVYALEVAVEEIKVPTDIVFINFSGTPTANNSAEEIRRIGQDLARMGNFDGVQHRIGGKYSIIEVTNNKEDGLFSAAILSIDPNAQVDHIRNVRNIVSGYLQYKYDYSRQDADTLAYFLSFYNAIHRGNVKFLQSSYKPEVLNFVNETNAGIAKIYSEWPGRTRFVTPLVAQSSVRLSELGNAVTQAVREASPNAGIEIRQELVNMKQETITQNQQEIDNAKQTLPVVQEQATQAQQQANQAQQQANTAQQQANTAQQQADQAKQQAEEATANNDPNAEALQKQAEEAQKQADQATQQANQAQQQADQQQQQADQAQKQADQQQQTITDRTQENQKLQQQVDTEQKQIAQDKLTQEVKQNPAKAAEELAVARDQLEGKSPFVGNKFYYMDVSTRFQGGHFKNKILAIDPAAGSVLATSLNNICNREFIAYGKGVVAVTATDDSHNSGHSLTMFNLDTLQPIATTPKEVNLYWGSFVTLDGGKIYAIVVGADKKFYLSRFNDQMQLEGQSVSTVDADTAITINQDKIYVNLVAQKQIVVLNKADLTILSQIKL